MSIHLCGLVKVHETRANVIGCFDRNDEYSSVADIPRSGSLSHDPHNVLDFIVVGDDLDHELGQQRHCVFDATIDNGLTSLMSASSNWRHRHAGRHALQGVDGVIKFLLPDNALD